MNVKHKGNLPGNLYGRSQGRSQCLRILVIFRIRVVGNLGPPSPSQRDTQLGCPCRLPSRDTSHPAVQLSSLCPNTSPLARLRQQVGQNLLFIWGKQIKLVSKLTSEDPSPCPRSLPWWKKLSTTRPALKWGDLPPKQHYKNHSTHSKSTERILGLRLASRKQAAFSQEITSVFQRAASRHRRVWTQRPSADVHLLIQEECSSLTQVHHRLTDTDAWGSGSQRGPP